MATTRAPNVLNSFAPPILWYFFVAAVLSLGAYYRLHQIDEQGLAVGDAVGYYKIALNWADGDTSDFWGDRYYRPVVYGLNALAIRWFGNTDFSIPMLNGFADLISLGLIMAIGVRITASLWPGVAAALVYAVLPRVIMNCRAGMPHALSALFVLLAVFLFLAPSSNAHRRSTRLLCDACAGLSAGLAANTHPELALLGPGFVLCQTIDAFRARISPHAFVWLVVRAAALTAGFAVPYLVGFAVFGVEKVVKVFSWEFENSTFTPTYIEERPIYLIPIDMMRINSAYFMGKVYWLPVLIAVPPVFWCWSRLRRGTGGAGPRLETFVPWILLVSYIAIFPFVIGATDLSQARLFIPLIPLTLLGAFCALFGFGSQIGPRVAPIPLLAGACLILLNGSAAWQGAGFFNEAQWFSKSSFRSAYDAVGRCVDPGHRMLIVPSSAYYNEGFQIDLYFGSNAQFLVNHTREGAYTPDLLAQIARSGFYSYIYFSETLDLRFTDPEKWPHGVRRSRWFEGSDVAKYSVEEEIAILNAFLHQSRAYLLAHTQSYRIFSLRKRSIFPNSGFERGDLAGWQLSGDAAAFAPRKDRGSSSGDWYFVDTRSTADIDTDFRRPTRRVETAGEIRSEPFSIEEPIIGFLLSGNYNPQSIHVALIVDGLEMRAGAEGEDLTAGKWDTSEYIGKSAVLAVRDLDSNPATGVRVNGFYYVF